MDKIFFCLGSISGFLGVMLGAFGAHALKERLDPPMMEVFEVGVRYQMYHAFALLATAWAVSHWSGSAGPLAGWFFVAGTVIFSGSLYVMALSGVRWLGAVTPLGGLAFMGGWVCLVWLVLKG